MYLTSFSECQKNDSQRQNKDLDQIAGIYLQQFREYDVYHGMNINSSQREFLRSKENSENE